METTTKKIGGGFGLKHFFHPLGNMVGGNNPI